MYNVPSQEYKLSRAETERNRALQAIYTEYLELVRQLVEYHLIPELTNVVLEFLKFNHSDVADRLHEIESGVPAPVVIAGIRGGAFWTFGGSADLIKSGDAW